MRVRAAKRQEETLRSSQDEGACAGKSLRGMIEAELQRVCIKWLRIKEEINENYDIANEWEEERLELKGQIKAYSHSLLIVIEPYNRGDDKRRKQLVSEAMARARHIHERMKARPTNG